MKKLLTVTTACVVSVFLVWGCSKKGSSSGDPTEAMMDHMKAMFALADASDCEKSAKALKDYASKNKSAIESLAKQVKEMEGKMSEEEKKKFEESMTKKFEPFMKENMGKLMEFGMKCQEQAKDLQEAFSFMEKIK